MLASYTHDLSINLSPDQRPIYRAGLLAIESNSAQNIVYGRPSEGGAYVPQGEHETSVVSWASSYIQIQLVCSVEEAGGAGYR